MAQQYGVIDIKAGTGFTRAQSNEHLRNYAKGAEEANMAGNLDSTRIHLNFEVGPGGVIKEVDKTRSIPQRIKEIEQQRGIDNPNDGKAEDDADRRKTVANIILMGSHDQMMELAFGDQYVGEKYLDEDGNLVKPDNSFLERRKEIEKWAQDMYKFIARKFGEQNIAAFVVHLDETTPHIHCTLLPIAQVKGKERYSWNKTFQSNKYNGANFFRKLHTEMAMVNRRWGLERGMDVRLTNNKHRSTEEYRAWLRELNSKLEEDVSQMQGNAKRLETKMKGLNTMLMHLEMQHNELTDELSGMEQKANDAKYDNDDLARRIAGKREELRMLEEIIDMRRTQINESKDQLDQLTAEEDALRQQCEKLDEQFKNQSASVQEKALRDMNSIAWHHAHMEAEYKADKIHAFQESLPPEYREKFDEIYDGSIFEDMTERAQEVVAVATSIFLGLPEQALAFSQAHGGGGGGGGAGGGWGRKKDEDDEAYAHRCFIMGRMLMHPVGRKLKR